MTGFEGQGPLTEDQVRDVLVEAMGERGVLCLWGRPTKNRRYCSQSCYRKSTGKDDVPPAMRRKLYETGSRELVEDSWRDAFWGIGPNGDGENWLGRLWMELREEAKP